MQVHEVDSSNTTASFKQYHMIKVQPACSKCTLPRCCLCASQVHEVDSSNTTASFKQYHVDQIAADMKDSICRVSDTPFDEQENANIPTVSYEVSMHYSNHTTLHISLPTLIDSAYNSLVQLLSDID